MRRVALSKYFTPECVESRVFEINPQRVEERVEVSRIIRAQATNRNINSSLELTLDSESLLGGLQRPRTPDFQPLSTEKNYFAVQFNFD